METFAQDQETPETVPEVTVDLCEGVLYTNRDGRTMAALVIGTPASDVPSKPGTVTLQVFSPRSGQYVKQDVAEGEGPTTFRTP